MWNMFKETLNKSWTLAFAGMTREQILARSAKKATSRHSRRRRNPGLARNRTFLKLRITNASPAMLYELRIGIISVVILFSLFDVASAQLRRTFILPAAPKDTSTFWIFKDVTAGPLFTAGIARQNEDLPDNWSSQSRFSYTIGATIDFFYSQWLGFDFSALYDARSLYADTAGESLNMSLGYLSFQPSIRIFWLLLGFSFDIPMSGSAIETLASYTRPSGDQPSTHNYNENLNVPTGDLNTITEIRATISIPILETDDAYLHFIVSGSYPLTKTIASTAGFDSTGYTPTSGIGTAGPPQTPGRFSGSSQLGKGPLPTIQAGISYQFDLIH